MDYATNCLLRYYVSSVLSTFEIDKTVSHRDYQSKL